MAYLPERVRDITTRISGEYEEIRGLQLTLAQVARLFDTDPRTVETVLNRLVASSFLCHTGAFYVRTDVGRRSA